MVGIIYVHIDTTFGISGVIYFFTFIFFFSLLIFTA